MNEHINFDFGRTNRTGIPEVIYAEGKEEPIVLKLFRGLRFKHRTSNYVYSVIPFRLQTTQS